MMNPLLSAALGALLLSGLLPGQEAPQKLTLGKVFGRDGFVSYRSGIRGASWAEDGKALRLGRRTVDPVNFEPVEVGPAAEKAGGGADAEALAAFEERLKEKKLRVPRARRRRSTVPRTPEGNPGLLRGSGGTAALVSGELWGATDGGELRQLTRSGGAKRRIEIAPDGSAVSFLDENDLYIAPVAGGKVHRLSRDASENLFYGELDWVYQEEVYGRFNFKATWWSPDSRWLAYLRIDEEGVPTFTVIDDIPTHPVLEPLKYPKAGDVNPRATLHIADRETGKVTAVDLGKYEGTGLLIVRVGWTPDSRPLFQITDREQSWLDLCTADPKTGKLTTWFREESKTWVNVLDGIHWLKDGSFLWESERTGYRHLYHYTGKGELVRAVTAGEWQITGVSSIDEERGEVVVTGTKDGAINRNTYIAKLDGSKTWRVTPGPGSHSVSWNGDASLALVSSNAVDNPGEVRLVRRDGQLVRILGRAPLPRAAAEYGHSMPELVSIPCRDGYELDGLVIKPRDFDPSKKYPVWIDIYGGPDAPTVSNSWQGSGWFQFLAQEGYVLYQFNVRSASGRGQKHTEACYQQMGSPETRDIEDAVKWLIAQGYADPERFGITGWSYGGFITASALCRTELFALGVAGGGVYTWRNYDTIYTERYMRTPQNNPSGYDDNSVLAHAKNLHGHLVIVHGAIDDNVHLQNAMQLAYELQKAGKHFDFMVYPQNRHGIRNREQFWHLRELTWRNMQEVMPGGGK